jgi:VWFA-related protein
MAGDRARQVAIGLAAAATIALSAQEQPPTFRAEIDYVQLPVRVLDANGQFVSGLRRGDFRILEDGKPQTITSFTLVDIPFVAPGSTTSPSTPLDSTPSGLDTEIPQADGRTYLFVLDDLSADADDTLKVRKLLHGFIRERMSANDIAAIRIIGGTRGQDFTLDHQLLHDAVDRFIGEREDDVTKARVRPDLVVSTVTSMVEWLSSIRGRHKALVWVSSSSLCSLQDENCREPLQHALRVTMQTDVTIHVIDPVGLTRAQKRSNAEHANPNSTYAAGAYTELSHGQAARAAFGDFRTSVRGPFDGARYLAEESGGIALVNMIDLRPGLDRIVREMSSYYLLGYYSTNARTDGKFRRNHVTVARKDVRVVHRNGYFAARGSK